MLKRLFPLLALTLVLIAPAAADERSTARRFERARRDEPSLIAFLKAMPKGGDLHNHASGALFPEDGLQIAIRDGLHFNPRTSGFQVEPAAGTVPAAELLRNDPLRYQFLNAAGLRGATSGPAGGHDHFFRAFGVLGSAWQKASRQERLANVVRRARVQNLQYLELMATPSGGGALDRVVAAAHAGLSHQQLFEALQPSIAEYVPAARRELDGWDSEVARLAELPAPISGPQGPVTVRYLITASRLAPEQEIFAVYAAAFALMKADSRVVGVNLAAPEDHPLARAGFPRQMAALDFLYGRCDRPNIALHAGELNLFISPLEAMGRPIRDSVVLGHARRIGHGSSIAWEERPEELLRLMRREGVAVEICPTSNAAILGLEGERHPFQLYRRAGVPLTLNTDDEGVNRSNLTLEFLRATRSWNLGYADLKELARNSLEYSFLPGESIWVGRDYRRLRRDLRGLARRKWQPNAAETTLLARSHRAAVQARLERALVEFEDD